MSINWHWSEKFGEAVFWNDDTKESYKLNIYSGNCLAIFLYEYEEKGKTYYNLADFWADEEHMLRGLGLRKEFNTNYMNQVGRRLSTITFYKDKISKSDLSRILKALGKADFENLLIILKQTETPFEENE